MQTKHTLLRGDTILPLQGYLCLEYLKEMWFRAIPTRPFELFPLSPSLSLSLSLSLLGMTRW